MKRKTTQRGNIGLHRSLLPAPAPPSCSLLLPTSCFLHPYSYLNTHVTFWLYSFDLTLEIFRVLYSFVSIYYVCCLVWKAIVSIVNHRENTCRGYSLYCYPMSRKHLGNSMSLEYSFGCIWSEVDHMVCKS